MSTEEDLPQHIAIIMDGNGRWAKSRGKPRHTGHRAGVKATRAIVEAAAERGVRALTLFAFSSENWSRPEEEVSSLMSLFFEVLQREVEILDKNNIRVRFVGAREQLSDRLQKKLAAAEAQTAGNDGMELALAVAYGGRWDIVNAVRQLSERVAAGELRSEDINDELFADSLSLAGMPPLDLLIRTGGEQRISNFLLWDMAYSELYFTPTLWPDFGAPQLDEALEFYAGRQRRFGRTGEQVDAPA
ncbi:MAG: di-trans,poly-cis-decaprenylcistransferase [Gammaproteobacteria bacterium]|nr:di-trans,poly-cis-decaprenylcistransferase [Gammaproteobacteria bacterium]